MYLFPSPSMQGVPTRADNGKRAGQPHSISGLFRRIKRALVVLGATCLGATAISPAPAATMSSLPDYIWRGATARACDGACTLEWFRDYLSEAQLSALEAARFGRPQPVRIDATGMNIAIMSFAEDGVPYTTRSRGTVGADAPGEAWGWRIADGVWVVRLVDCSNWALLTRRDGAAPAPQPLTTLDDAAPGGGFGRGPRLALGSDVLSPNGASTPAVTPNNGISGGGLFGGGGSGGSPTLPLGQNLVALPQLPLQPGPSLNPRNPQPVSAPLPPVVWMMLSALGALGWLGARRRVS